MAQSKRKKLQPAEAKDDLDQLAEGDKNKIMALMLWKYRHSNPDMFVQINREDLEKFDACMEYQKVKADVMVRRPQGVPAQPPIPASPGRRAVEGREAIPPRDYVMVALVEKGTQNAIKPIENNQEDYDKAQDLAAIKKARDQAPFLAAQLINQGRTGEFSVSDMNDAAQALSLLARAV